MSTPPLGTSALDTPDDAEFQEQHPQQAAHGPLPPMRPVVKSESHTNVNAAAATATVAEATAGTPSDCFTLAEDITYANPLIDQAGESTDGDDLLSSAEPDTAESAAVATEAADQLPDVATALVADSSADAAPPSTVRIVRPRTTSESVDASSDCRAATPLPPVTVLSSTQRPALKQQHPQQQQISVADYFTDLGDTAAAAAAMFDQAAASGLGIGGAAADLLMGSAEDWFTDSIRTGEAERQMDAWLPSEATRQLLDSIAAGKLDSAKVEQSQLTRPTVLYPGPQPNPMRDLLLRFCGESIARGCAPNADSVPQDATGASQLFRSGCYRACLDLLGRLLVQAGAASTRHSPQTLRLWFARLALLTRTRQVQAAEAELAAFRNLDGPDLYYDFYPSLYPNRRGSMVPFGLRLLHAELGGQGALVRLYFLVAVIDRMLCNLAAGLSEAGLDLASITPEQRRASSELWQRRKAAVLYSVANNLLAARDQAAAVRVYAQLLELDPGNAERIWAALGRLCMQVGDLQAARHHLGRCAALAPADRRDFYAALLAVTAADWQTAQRLLRASLEANPAYVLAANNLAVICLYTGQLREAIRVLESLLEREPQRAMQEGLVFNLCTMYDLESSKAVGKKTTLLETVARHRGDNFDVAAFKF